MKLNNLVVFMGERKSGKDYLGEHLANRYGFVRLSFSDEVRRLSNQLFPWMEFDYPPDVKDKVINHPRNVNGLTPRQIWLTVGKVRDVEPKYFVNMFVRNQFSQVIGNPDINYYITDFRTPNEHDFRCDWDLPVVKIVRADRTGIEPDAFEEYVRNYDSQDATFINHMNGVVEFDAFFKEFWTKQGRTL